jgi:hypothetical protein
VICIVVGLQQLFIFFCLSAVYLKRLLRFMVGADITCRLLSDNSALLRESELLYSGSAHSSDGEERQVKG